MAEPDDIIKPFAGHHQELLSSGTGSDGDPVSDRSLHINSLISEMHRHNEDLSAPLLVELPSKPNLGYESARPAAPRDISPLTQGNSTLTTGSKLDQNKLALSAFDSSNALTSSNTSYNVPHLSLMDPSRTPSSTPAGLVHKDQSEAPQLSRNTSKPPEVASKVVPGVAPEVAPEVAYEAASEVAYDTPQAPIGVGQIRGYQLEVSRKTLNGENDIIILPTGTGKTRVAINLMLNHLKKNPDGKILFTTPNRVIAEQQTERIKDLIPDRIVRKVVGGDLVEGSPQLKEMLEEREPQIVVLTPQLVCNYMLAFPEDSNFERFSLIILDECHSAAVANNPSRNLLDFYHEALLNGITDSVTIDDMRKRLPQLVGLTATIGCGSKKTRTTAREHVEGICARFDMRHAPTEVSKYKDELERFTSKPTKYVKTVTGTDDNKEFVGKLTSIIKELHVYLREQLLSSDAEALRSLGRVVDPMRTTGYAALLSRCKEFFDAIVAQHDHQARKEAMNSIKVIKHIKIYVTMRHLAEVSECKTALKQIVKFMQEPERGREIQNIEPYDKYINLWKAELTEIAKKEDEKHKNKKLEVLKETLDEIFNRDATSQIMLFAERRDLCKILTEWIANLDERYKPHMYISSRDVGDRDRSMSTNEQSEVMENFRDKNYNILVSTSIGELGLDIPDCNATITYMNIKDYISGKQVAGRSRDLDGFTYYILTAADVRRLQDFDVDEKRQNEALSSVRALTSDQFQTRMDTLLRGIQGEIRLKRKKEEDDRKNKPHDARILCSQCGYQLSTLAKIKLYLESAYIVIDSDLAEKLYCIRGNRDEDFVLDDMRAIGRMYCKHDYCNNHVGKIFMMDGHYLPRWKLEKVRLAEVPDRCDKWSQIRKKFYVEKITFNQLLELLEEAADVEVREPVADEEVSLED